jgi:ParB-like chromosome segregation protein Spo0J
MTAELVKLKISSVDPNPMRQLKKYPFNENKIGALRRSIRDVGLWEGVIARRAGNRVELAFGHHRLEAARKELGNDARISIILRDLSDEEMLKFMGRENLEDYNADFLVMLETWDAATRFRNLELENVEPIDIARLLGWTLIHNREERMSQVGRACSDAAKLIAGGYLTSQDLAGLPVRSVLDIVSRVVSQHERIEKMATVTQRPTVEVTKAKKISGRAGVRVARDVREGRVALKDIRGQVDVEAYRHAREAKKQSPLFSMFGKSLADSIAKIARSDALAEKFNEVKRSLNMLTFDEDVQVVKRIALECENASDRFEGWRKTFHNPQRKIVKLKEIGQ